MQLAIVPNETATVNGTDPFEGSVGPATQGAFLKQQLNAERPPARVASLPPRVATQVAQMPGGNDLYETGEWAEAPQYGPVWYPPVPSGWTPYRHGHWAFVAPWGWTWVDDAPWGFAPFHDGRWAWTPGAVQGPAVYAPVYAPALVTFVGIGAGVAIGAALASGSIGWCPLGPGEPYRPWYHASNNYIRQVNVSYVTNITNTTVNNNFINRGATTVVPASVMRASRPVQDAVQPVPPRQLADARPIIGQPPLRPGAATAGVTPAVARQMHLAPPLPGAVHGAPGPIVQPQPLAAAGSIPLRPALPPRPGTAATPAASMVVPHLPGQSPPATGQRQGGQLINRMSLPAGGVPPGTAPAAVGAPFNHAHLPNLPSAGAAQPPGGPTPLTHAGAATPLPGWTHAPGAINQPLSQTSASNLPSASGGQGPLVPHQPPTHASLSGAPPVVGAQPQVVPSQPLPARGSLPDLPSPTAGQPPVAPNAQFNHVPPPNQAHVLSPAMVPPTHVNVPPPQPQHLAAPVQPLPQPQVQRFIPPPQQTFHTPPPQFHATPQPQPQPHPVSLPPPQHDKRQNP
ncbi:MAG: DUF6600 domain-containing protein [Rhodopila sp.]